MKELYHFKKEIEQLEEEKAELEEEKADIENQIKEISVLRAVAMNGMPKCSQVSSPVEQFNIALEQLKEKLQRKCAEILTKIKRIDECKEHIKEYIKNIEEAEVRAIVRKRFIENKTYQAIGEEMHIDGTTARKKLKRYFERTEGK